MQLHLGRHSDSLPIHLHFATCSHTIRSHMTCILQVTVMEVVHANDCRVPAAGTGPLSPRVAPRPRTGPPRSVRVAAAPAIDERRAAGPARRVDTRKRSAFGANRRF